MPDDLEHLADALASRDAHLTLDLPVSLAAAIRELLAARESEIAALKGKLAGAELALLNQTRRTVDREYSERMAHSDYSYTASDDGDCDADDAGYYAAVQP